MKTRIKFTVFFFAFLAMILFIGMPMMISSCEAKPSEEEVSTPSRIIIKENTTGWGAVNQYEIVEVDGIEYLTSTNGGIIALPKR